MFDQQNEQLNDHSSGKLGEQHPGAQSTHLSDHEREDIVDQIRITHAHVQWVLETIEDCRQRSKRKSEVQTLLVTGEPGSGKSSTFNMYVKKHLQIYDDYLDDGTIVKKRNILATKLPSPSTHKSVKMSLLQALGDKFAFREDKEYILHHRLVNLIKATGVELILLDEFQNFYRIDRKNDLQKITDWFKSLMEETHVPVVLFGLPDAKQVFNKDKQADRRLHRTIDLERFSLQKGKDRLFLRFLEEFDKRLPFSKLSNLAHPEIAEMIFSATGGLPFSISTLIYEASCLAIKEGAECISVAHLEDAFEVNQFVSKNIMNPFAS